MIHRLGVITTLFFAFSACPEPTGTGNDTSGEIESDLAGLDIDGGADGDGSSGDGGAVEPGDGDVTGDSEVADGVDGGGPEDVGDTSADGDATATWPPPDADCSVDDDCLPYLDAAPFDTTCMRATCNTTTATCVFDETALDGEVCGQDDPCIQEAECFGGFCKVIVPTCDDGIACTENICDAQGDCSYEDLFDGDPCDDGIACTTDDFCDDEGGCSGTPTEACQCQQVEDCETLPLNACTGGWVCTESYTCVVDPANSITCDTSNDGPCATNLCNPATGECQLTNASNGAPCDAETACIPVAVCTDGTCSGPEVQCGDGKPCTTDSCDPSSGNCVYVNDNGAPCDDNNPCSINDICDAGNCVASGEMLDCDDDNPCTADQCEPGQEGCVYGNLSFLPCDDGDLCAVGDTCDQGVCTAGAQVVSCDDGEACTTDACDSATGDCVFTPTDAACDDGDICTENDSCSSGSCAGTAITCDDENPCTDDTCAEQDGFAACINAPSPFKLCSDGDACTVDDFCFQGNCIPGSLDSACAGCSSNADCASFQSDNLCVGTFICNPTTFQCEADPATEITCPPMEVGCTSNQCDPTDGACKMLPKEEGTACDDGQPCTEGDLCNSLGSCSGAPKDCDDGLDCTSDICDLATGACDHAQLATNTNYLTENFDSGLPGTWSIISDNVDVTWAVTADENAGGAAGQAMRLTGTDLTYDYGRTEAELRLPPLVLQGEVTLSFSIKADFAEETGAFNQCFTSTDHFQVRVYTSDSQYSASYCLSNNTDGAFVQAQAQLPSESTPVTIAFVFRSNEANNGGSGVVIDNVQIDGLATCDTSAACIPGVCSSGTCMEMPHECDDADPCTTDSCDVSTGNCVFTPVPGCQCGEPSDCGFSFNPCIAVICDNGTCSEEILTGACDDDNPCTENGVCVDAECQSDPIDCGDGNPCTKDECNPFLAPGEICFHTPATLPCDDGLDCTLNDTCTLAGDCAGTVIDCSEGGCLEGACIEGSGCEFTGIKSEGKILWQHNFETNLPGEIPEGWTEDEAAEAYFWTVQPTATSTCGGDAECDVGETCSNGFCAVEGFTIPLAQSAPFYLGTESFNFPGEENAAATSSITTELYSLPLDGGWLSFYLYLERSPAYQDTVNFSDDVFSILANGQLVYFTNGHAPSWNEVIVDLPAATWGGADVQFTFVWANGENSVGQVAIDTMALKAHAFCDDDDVCTEDDRCFIGTCEGSAIPGCTP